MSDTAEIAEMAADGVADGMHIVSEEALAVEQAVRGLEGAQLAYIGFGVVIGAAAGALIAFRVAYRRAETKYNQITAEEIAEMRQHYAAKAVALENAIDKPKLEDIVREQGYAAEEESVRPPMAVTPPAAVVKAAEEMAEEEATDDTPQRRQEVLDNLEEESEPQVRNVFQEAAVVDDWDYHKERARRSPLRPYVIHRDEREDHDAYDDVTFTYYEADDVLCNERDEVVPEGDRERLIGESSLEKFGHGSGDASVVYIRNDQMEIDFEVVRSPNSYAEEVHGFEPQIRHADRRREGTKFDDE